MQARAFAAQHQHAVAGQVELVVVGSASFVQADDPHILLFQVFQGTDQVDDAGNAKVFGCSVSYTHLLRGERVFRRCGVGIDWVHVHLSSVDVHRSLLMNCQEHLAYRKDAGMIGKRSFRGAQRPSAWIDFARWTKLEEGVLSLSRNKVFWFCRLRAGWRQFWRSIVNR